MSSESKANQRERSLAENIVIIALVASLMGSFVYYFFKQEDKISRTGFDAIAAKFLTRLTAIRAQWFMDNQPVELFIKDENKDKLRVRVNKKGWVDYSGESENCQKIWRVVMDHELIFMKQPIIVLELMKENEPLKHVCRYQITSHQYFDYYLANGQVSEINN